MGVIYQWLDNDGWLGPGQTTLRCSEVASADCSWNEATNTLNCDGINNNEITPYQVLHRVNQRGRVERCIADVGMPDELDFSIKGCGVLATPAHCSRPSYGGQDMCKWKKGLLTKNPETLHQAETGRCVSRCEGENEVGCNMWSRFCHWFPKGKPSEPEKRKLGGIITRWDDYRKENEIPAKTYGA